MNILSILIIGAFLIFIFKEDSSVNKAAERETRICQHCRQQIPYRATVCPYCRRNPGRDWRAENRVFKHSIILRIMVFLLILTVLFLEIATLLGRYDVIFAMAGG